MWGWQSLFLSSNFWLKEDINLKVVSVSAFILLMQIVAMSNVTLEHIVTSTLVMSLALDQPSPHCSQPAGYHQDMDKSWVRMLISRCGEFWPHSRACSLFNHIFFLFRAISIDLDRPEAQTCLILERSPSEGKWSLTIGTLVQSNFMNLYSLTSGYPQRTYLLHFVWF